MNPPSTPRSNRPYSVGKQVKLAINLDPSRGFTKGLVVTIDRVGTRQVTGTTEPTTSENSKYYIRAEFPYEHWQSLALITSHKVAHKKLALNKGGVPQDKAYPNGTRVFLLEDFNYNTTSGRQRLPNNSCVQVSSLPLSNSGRKLGPTSPINDVYYNVSPVQKVILKQWVPCTRTPTHFELEEL